MEILNKLTQSKNYFLLQGVICTIAYLLSDMWLFKIGAALMLLFCLTKGRKQVFVINPYYLFILTPISLLLYYNISDVFFVDLIRDTWLLILLNTNAVLLALSYTSPIRVKERKLSIRYAKKLYTYCSIVFTTVGIIPPIIYRFTGNIIPLAYIITMLGVAGVLCAMATKRKYLIICVVSLYLVPILIGGTSKSAVLTLILALLISYERFYVNRNNIRKSRKILVLGCALAIPLMILSFSFATKDRDSLDADSTLSKYNSRVEWEGEASLFMPYMYLETPWANLQYVIETQDNRSYGYWLTKPILGTFMGDKLEDPKYAPHTVSSFNTFSFIALHFKDFGYWGSILLSLFIGFFIKKVYTLYVASNSPFDSTCYVFTAIATFEMFFSNHFFGQSYPFMIVIVMYLVKKFLKI